MVPLHVTGHWNPLIQILPFELAWKCPPASLGIKEGQAIAPPYRQVIQL